MSEHETEWHCHNNTNTLPLYTIDSVIDTNCKQDLKYTLLAARVSTLEQEIQELRHILSGRQFMQRTLSYEDTTDSK